MFLNTLLYVLKVTAKNLTLAAVTKTVRNQGTAKSDLKNQKPGAKGPKGRK